MQGLGHYQCLAEFGSVNFVVLFEQYREPHHRKLLIISYIKFLANQFTTTGAGMPLVHEPSRP